MFLMYKPQNGKIKVSRLLSSYPNNPDYNEMKKMLKDQEEIDFDQFFTITSEFL